MSIKHIYVSDESQKNLDQDLEDAVQHWAKFYKFEPALIKAFVEHESMNYVFAYRVDFKSLRRQKWYLNTLTKDEKEYKKFYASYGVMQMLYGLAKSLNFKNEPECLFNPFTNIYFGCKHLKNLFERYKELKDVISVYNWGSLKKTIKGKYRNQNYVDSVYNKYKKFGGKNGN